MPRVVVGIVAGAGLSVAGAVMQSTLMNPLADSYTTGVSSGASFGATVAMTLGMTAASGSQAIVINAFLFALIPTAMIISVSKMKNASPTTMIMAGIAIMYIFNAFTTVMMLWADESTLAEVYQWQVGTLAGTTWSEVPIMIVAVLAGIVAVQLLSRKLNVLATGDETARALGVDASKMRIILLVIVALMSAAVVSFTGLIGFVGLVTPHIVRIFIGADNRYLIPASAIAGSALLVTADLLGRAILSPVVLQVGVVMAFIGGPMFLWLLMRKNSRVWG
jgi:iron complex transport system permease protein